MVRKASEAFFQQGKSNLPFCLQTLFFPADMNDICRKIQHKNHHNIHNYVGYRMNT